MSKSNHARWQAAVAEMKTVSAALDITPDPTLRAHLYDLFAALNVSAALAVDLSMMPALDADGGQSYAQVYADTAVLLSILGSGERMFGRYRPGALGRSIAPRPERDLWERYLSSADRNARAEVLIRLYDLIAARVGYEAASVLNLAARSEKAISR